MSVYQNHQIIILDLDGVIVDSSDTIFPTSGLSGFNVCDFFPLIESIFTEIKNRSTTNPIVIEKVQSVKSFLEGIYHYQFYTKIIEGTKRIIWEIYDFTDYYQQKVKEQQTRQSNSIEEELKDRHKQEEQW